VRVEESRAIGLLVGQSQLHYQFPDHITQGPSDESDARTARWEDQLLLDDNLSTEW
jgi:hypothetical protein